MLREYNFDSLVGPTHHYGGLSLGNLASTTHRGEPANPRAAALQGLEKMRFVAGLGVGQAVLPPQRRPSFKALRRLGFSGSDAEMLAQARRSAPELLSLCSSASAMWAANAATVAPSVDTQDGRVHFTPANLIAMFHRSLEAEATARVLRAIFASSDRFMVHEPLPASDFLSDEGAANHTRLATERAVVHLFGWGRSSDSKLQPRNFPARQTRAASQALVRLHQLRTPYLLWQQAPEGIDAGSFHSDVLAVGNQNLLLLHEFAFVNTPELLQQLHSSLGAEFRACVATLRELPIADAVAAYPFNSQLLSLPNGKMALIAPGESREAEPARRFLERVVAEDNPVTELHFVDVKGSMKNGGGPACLRLRVPLTDEERAAVRARVFLDDALYTELKAWVQRTYRDRLTLDDLADPSFCLETLAALEELYGLLGLPEAFQE